MPTRFKGLFFVAAFVLMLAESAGAQMVSGTVVNGTTGAPVTGATVVITATNDSTERQITNTDGRGEFLLAGLRPGEYFLYIRKIGFSAVEPPRRMLRDGESWTGYYEMQPTAATLDTMRTSAEKPDLTPGSEWFMKHYRAGKGFFTSGKEIILSRLNACDFFGRIPGLRISTITPLYEDLGGIRCADGRYVVVDSKDYPCMRTYLDRTWTISQLDSTDIEVRTQAADRLARRIRGDTLHAAMERAADTVPRFFPLERIAGIEVFRNSSEVPKDFSVPLFREPDPPYLRHNSMPGNLMRSAASAPTSRITSTQCGVVLVWTYTTW